MTIHTCLACEVEHRGDKPVCWLCGGPVVSTVTVAESTAGQAWEVGAMVENERRRKSEVL